MNVLGLSFGYHDSAAALVQDGKITFADQEERYSRIKNDNAFPIKAASECIDFAPTLSINDYGATKSAIKAGHGIGELPEPLCKAELQLGDLVEVLPDWQFPEIKLYAVHSGNGALSKLARRFLSGRVSALR